MRHVPDQFQVNSEVLVDDYIAKVIHAAPRYFGVLAREFIRDAYRCFPCHLQRVKYCPLEDFIGFEFLVRQSFEVIRHEVDGIEDVP